MPEGNISPPLFLVDSELTLVRAVLNRIIPAADGFPAAGDLGVAEHVDRVVGSSVELKRLFAEGLARIRIKGDATSPNGFTGMPDTRKDEVLREVEVEHRRFFEALVKQTYNGYYSNPRIMRLLGPAIRPPLPHGHDVEPGNLAALEQVMARGPVYREV